MVSGKKRGEEKASFLKLPLKTFPPWLKTFHHTLLPKRVATPHGTMSSGTGLLQLALENTYSSLSTEEE